MSEQAANLSGELSGERPDELPGELRWPLLDRALRVTGGGLALLGGVVTGLLTVLLVPLRVANVPWLAEALSGARGLRIPAALVVAIAGALFLVWFARRATGLRWAAALPLAGWFLVVVLALRGSDAGDRLMVPNDWIGALALFGGTLVLVVGAVIGVAGGGRPR